MQLLEELVRLKFITFSVLDCLRSNGDAIHKAMKIYKVNTKVLTYFILPISTSPLHLFSSPKA